MASKTLYPPILDSWMPSFIIDEGCKIKFNLSNFNSLSDININNVQVTIRDASSNKSLVKSSSEIIFKQMYVEGDEKFIILTEDDVKEGFYKNKYYKVQIRFIDNKCGTPQNNATWINSNLDHFSEWSTVCLIKGIKKPIINLKNLDLSTGIMRFYTDSISIVGEMEFEPGEKETLDSYRIIIEGLYDSGLLYTNEYSPNTIQHDVAYSLTNLVGGALQKVYDDRDELLVDNGDEALLSYGINHFGKDGYYYLNIEYTTSNGYTNVDRFALDINLLDENNFNGTIEVIPNEVEGFNQILVKSLNTLGRNQIVIRRTSSESRFLFWEDVAIIEVKAASAINEVFIDRTVKSGVWYQYSTTTVDAGIRDNTIKSEIVINHFYDAFLVADNKQLKIEFDNKMSSFKTITLESKVDTLGGKYPIIRRNGDVSYRTFPITGTISYHMDEGEELVKREGLYGPAITKMYHDYNVENEITPLYDYVYERDFREKVMQFLQSPSVKLFKSMTEGNIVVRLMDISFTPNDTLDRLVYSFSATAYEIAESTVANYDKYNIQTIRR